MSESATDNENKQKEFVPVKEPIISFSFSILWSKLWGM